MNEQGGILGEDQWKVFIEQVELKVSHRVFSSLQC
jgi:hypothetical protein